MGNEDPGPQSKSLQAAGDTLLPINTYDALNIESTYFHRSSLVALIVQKIQSNYVVYHAWLYTSMSLLMNQLCQMKKFVK